MSWFHSSHKGVCPSEAGSFWDMPPSPEKGQERLCEQGECQVHWTPPPRICYHLTWPKQSEVLLFCSESEINHEGVSWHCHLVCKANLLTELTTTVLEMGCVDGSKHKWVTMSLSYLTHFICLRVVSMMWHVCQQLRLCVFLQFTVLISGCLSGCWQLL